MGQGQCRVQSQSSLLMIRLASPCHGVIKRSKPGTSHPHRKQASGKPEPVAEIARPAGSSNYASPRNPDGVDEQKRCPLDVFTKWHVKQKHQTDNTVTCPRARSNTTDGHLINVPAPTLHDQLPLKSSLPCMTKCHCGKDTTDLPVKKSPNEGIASPENCIDRWRYSGPYQIQNME